MTSLIVQTNEMVTLLGGGAMDPGDLEVALSHAPLLVAADGGADRALAEGLMPEAVIGDFDSLSEEARRVIPAARLHPIAEQETTDFDKCLRLVEAPLLLGVGFLGARLDHKLAALAGLTRAPGRRCILIGGSDIVFLCPPELRIELEPGSRLSLFPMGPVRGESRGLKWPIRGIDFLPGGRIGTSNRVEGGVVELSMAAPLMLVIVPRAGLGAAISALC
ncbi:thiamine diphosphokinase [Actibacterium sp. MT2.3-13A]|uniref:thiamine diphosphokinase n=1 Tax=Actibacterium sp. MT2.3-13A TaxID=2828332 RepID=UPI001BA8B302|nr:thiamine diphosphokinase [Actibacterium sp. MT2.3-13A]